MLGNWLLSREIVACIEWYDVWDLGVWVWEDWIW